MFVWWIIRQPADFSEHYVVQKQHVFKNECTYEPIVGLYDSLDEARQDIPKGLARFRRHEMDDPSVVESWL